ncbi:MAG: molybdate ABC transporter permease subunit [Bacteroidota bacterium]
MNSEFWTTLILTFQLAGTTTLLLLLMGIPLAYLLAFRRFRGKAWLETLISMPLVLPPTVLGFYLLLAFSPESMLGRFFQDALGVQLVFSFPGLVLGSFIYSLPFMVQPLQSGFQQVPTSLIETAKVFGKYRMETLWKVILPNMKPAIITGIVLSFAHTIGEFGVILMIGGNIPGVTRVASIAIYDEVESLQYAVAHQYAGTLFVLTFVILLMVNLVNRSQWKREML